MADWYYQTEKGAEAGPVSNTELRNLVSSGAITPDSMLRKDDAKWVKASAVGGLFEAVKEARQGRPAQAGAHEEDGKVCSLCCRCPLCMCVCARDSCVRW